jgi:hypothetical protein
MSAPADALRPDQKRLLAEASDWHLISLLFQCPSADWRLLIGQMSEETEDSDLKAAVAAAKEEATEGLYHSIFGPGGPAPPREVSHRNIAQTGYLISELTSYYEAFCYRPDIREPADHVAVETGFVGYLRLKEAYALECGDSDHAEVTRNAARQFIDEHLSELAGRLTLALAGSHVNYLASAVNALLCRTGPPGRLGGIELPVLLQEESVFDCGEA